MTSTIGPVAMAPAPGVPDLGFAADDDTPIAYLQRVRTYYQALGYGAPYVWAHCADVPFRPLAKPLSACRVAIVTTAAPGRTGGRPPSPGKAR